MSSLRELYRTVFFSLLACRDLRFEGTRVFKGAQKGPKIAALAMTHGNEPAGLSLFNFLAKNQVIKGEVWLILGNTLAATKYFESPPEESHKFRGVNINFNRLSPDLFQTEDPETTRLKQILQTLSQADYILDFHSTSLPSPTMLIPNSAGQTLNFPKFKCFDVILTDIISLMRHKPIIGHFDLPGFVIECGPHESESSFKFAARFAETFLATLDMIPNTNKGNIQVKEPEIFKVFEAVWFPDDDFEMVKDFYNFEPVHKNQPLAVSKKTNQQILAPEDCHILFPFPKGKEKGSREEAFFLARKV